MSKKVPNMQKQPPIDVNQLIDQNHALRRELEVQQRTVEALSTGALSGVVQAFQEQLRKVIAERDHFKMAVDYFYNLAKRRYDDEQVYANELIQHAKEEAQNHNTPYMVERLLNAITELSRAVTEQAEQVKTMQFPDQISHRIYWLMQYTTLESLWHFGGAMAVIAWGEAGDTRMIAHEIIRECELAGAPHIKTVERFTVDWIEANLPEPPATYKTLREGLISAQAIKNGKAEDAGIGERQQRKVLNWYNAIKQHSHQKPALLEGISSPTIGL